MRVRLSRRAETDLIEITDFIALDNPERASEFENELLEHAHKLLRHRSAMLNGQS
jgi:toxin ParE1/3/4